MRGAQRERVQRHPLSHAKADETVALGAHEKELIFPDEAVACGAAAQAAVPC